MYLKGTYFKSLGLNFTCPAGKLPGRPHGLPRTRTRLPQANGQGFCSALLPAHKIATTEYIYTHESTLTHHTAGRCPLRTIEIVTDFKNNSSCPAPVRHHVGTRADPYPPPVTNGQPAQRSRHNAHPHPRAQFRRF